MNIQRERARAEVSARSARRAGLGLADLAFGSLILLAFYYLAYRYPLQIGSSLTSPTYTDTPPALQTGKYVLIVAILLIVATAAAVRGPLGERTRDAHPLSSWALLLLSVFAILKGLFAGSVDQIIVGLVSLVPVVLSSLSARRNVDGRRLAVAVVIYAVISVVVDAVQFVLYRVQGRLPSLGYEGSISVRFGAVLDDPNGYALIVALAVPVVFAISTRAKFIRYVLILLLLVSLLLTQSFTGIASVLGALILGYVGLHWRSLGRTYAISIGGIVLLVVVWLFTSTSELYDAVVASKLGSINQHAGTWDEVRALSLEQLAGLGPAQGGLESSYVALAANFGLVYVVIYIWIGVAACRRLLQTVRSSTDSRDSAAHLGFYFFLIAYLFASINLSLEGSYPSNFLFMLGVALSFFAVRSDDPASGLVGRSHSTVQSIRVTALSTPKGFS